jgi:hypothetical protein
MKRQLSKIALSLALTGSLTGFSQSQHIQPCNTYAAMEEHFAADPAAKKRFDIEQAKLNQAHADYELAKANGKAAATVYTVPVVFHILHQGGGENITDQQCISALAQVNKDYAREGSDTSQIFAPFKSLYINSDIKFMLAHKDPNGNCTSGIEHIYDARTNWQQANAGTNYTGITWDPTKYLNIIIVKNIVPTNTVVGGGIIVGYTYLPGTWGTGASQDAIVYHYSFLGGLDARSLSHEIGHWLNLIHTFGNTNNPGVVCGSSAGGDQVSDTPDTKGNFSTCPNSSTNTAYTCSSPNPTNSANYYQNVQNIMDYSSCPKNFTTGQTNRMRSALAGGAGGRNNLSTAANLTFTDVDGLGNCAPIAEFLSTTNAYTVCAGGSLTLKDFSYNGTVTAYAWSGTSGVTFASPTSSLTTATFTTPGVASVTLTVSNSNGSSSDVKNVTVINAGAPVAMPYSESFEAAGLPANWSIVNPDNGVTWAQTGIAASTGAASYYIDGTSNSPGQTDYLYMPMIDILNNPNDTMTFKYAYARYSSSNNDLFKIEASKDCGGTWGSVFAPSISSLASASGGVSTVPFAPSASQWAHVNLSNYPNWFNYTTSSTVLLRFSFTSYTTGGGGNNFYLDDINFSGNPGVGMKELSKSVSFNLFPNPSTGEATVKFKLDDAAKIKIEVLDIVGKKVLPSVETNYGVGEQSVSINKNKSLSQGVYFVNLSVNGAKMIKKLIIE